MFTSTQQSPWCQQANRPAKKPHAKSARLKAFEDEYHNWYYSQGKMANIPEYGRVRTHFNDGTANDLTKTIIAWLTMHGAFGARINCGGRYLVKQKKWIRSGARDGMADISAVYHGKALQIEIKVGKDRPRADQLKVQEEYRKSGGYYEFIHNFDEFLDWIETL